MNIVFTLTPGAPHPQGDKPRIVANRIYRDGRKGDVWYYPKTRRLMLILSVDGEIQHCQPVASPFAASAFIDTYHWKPRSREHGRNRVWKWN